MSNKSILEQSIEKYKKEIHSDAYPMSIGECVNMYINGEIDIQPEFQRFYRWSISQKTKFIESILLGIPIPSFFVAQRDDGIWDLVDGLQRFSTILSFMGELKDEKNIKIEPLILSEGTYLKELNGLCWNKISNAIKLAFRREKLDFKIIKKESTSDTKYELFRRLNTGGSQLSEQEVRNCLLLMTNREFYEWIQNLSHDENFKSSIILSQDQIDKQYDLELIVRFIVYSSVDWKTISSNSFSDIGEFLNDEIIKCAKNPDFDYTYYTEKFKNTFHIINNALGQESFKKFYSSENRHKGAFSIALYESISTGIAFNYDSLKNISPSRIKELIEKFSQEQDFLTNSGSGIRANTRSPKIVPLAINFFKNG